MPDPALVDPNANQPWLNRNLPELMTVLGSLLAPLRFGHRDIQGQRHGLAPFAPIGALGPLLMKQRELDTQRNLELQQQALKGAALQKMTQALEPSEGLVPAQIDVEDPNQPAVPQKTGMVAPSEQEFMRRMGTISPAEMAASGVTPFQVYEMAQKLRVQPKITKTKPGETVEVTDQYGNVISTRTTPKEPAEPKLPTNIAEQRQIANTPGHPMRAAAKAAVEESEKAAKDLDAQKAKERKEYGQMIQGLITGRQQKRLDALDKKKNDINKQLSGLNNTKAKLQTELKDLTDPKKMPSTWTKAGAKLYGEKQAQIKAKQREIDIVTDRIMGLQGLRGGLEAAGEMSNASDAEVLGALISVPQPGGE